MSRWYYSHDRQVGGPVTDEELKARVEQGQLAPDDLIWCEGMTGWKPAREVGGLQWPAQTAPVSSASRPPPPPPPSIIQPAQVANVAAARQVPKVCPLCGKSEKLNDPRLLYDHFVCKKCYYAFTNRRQLAYFVDWLVITGLMMVPVVNLAVIVLCFGKDCFAGQSVGKAMCGVKVINKQTGAPGGFGMSFKRNLCLIIPFMPLVVGFTLSKGYRIGDGWAKSKVIWKKYETHPIFAPDKSVN